LLGVLQKLEEINTKVDVMDTKFEMRMDRQEASSMAEDRGSAGNIMKTPPKLARKNPLLGEEEESVFEQETPKRRHAASATMSTPPVVVSGDADLILTE
jgi:hypothetical protein